MGSSGYSLIDIFFLLVREHRQFYFTEIGSVAAAWVVQM